jgi:hypothetical protein
VSNGLQHLGMVCLSPLTSYPITTIFFAMSQKRV